MITARVYMLVAGFGMVHQCDINNIEDASVTVKGIMDDIVNGKIDLSIGTCNKNEKCILSKIEGIDPAGIVTWDDFLKIDRHEILNGKRR